MMTAKEIRNKIFSIQGTKKITKTMEMVSAVKMRKAQKRVKKSSSYSHAIKKIIQHIILSNTEYKHPYFEERETKRVGYFIISSDRGLCGSLNLHLFKKILLKIKYWSKKGVEVDLAIVGSKGFSFFNASKCNTIAYVNNLGDAPEISEIIGIIKSMLSLYDKKNIDKLFIASNTFINTVLQSPKINLLLPLTNTKKEDQKEIWDYIYEPNSKFLLDFLLMRYVEFQVYQSLIENIASEQAARMIAMKTATDNGERLISELKLSYNKVRQTNITKELIEIISGASVI